MATLLLARQFTQNVVEIAAPYIMERLKFWRLSYRMTRTLSERSLRRHVEKAKEDRKRRESLLTEPLNIENNIYSYSEGMTDSEGKLKRPDSLTSREQWSPLRLRKSRFSAKNMDLLSKLASSNKSSFNSRLPLPEFCPTESNNKHFCICK